MMWIPLLGFLAAQRLSTRPVPADVPIPLSVGWVEGFLITIVWLFAAAVLVGPLVNYFKLEPRSTQVFVDDKKSRSS